jgi:preprotein translocase subunit YajC
MIMFFVILFIMCVAVVATYFLLERLEQRSKQKSEPPSLYDELDY